MLDISVGISVAAGKAVGEAAPAFSIDDLYDGGNNPGGYMDLSTLAGTVYEDTGGTDVAEINDAVALVVDGGPSGYDFTQGTVAERPALKNDGTHNYLEFDGTGDNIIFVTNPGTTLASKRLLLGYAINTTDTTFAFWSQHDASASVIGLAVDTSPNTGLASAGITIHGIYVDGVLDAGIATQDDLSDAVRGAKHTVIIDAETPAGYTPNGTAKELVFGNYAGAFSFAGDLYAMAWAARDSAPTSVDIEGVHNWLDERIN